MVFLRDEYVIAKPDEVAEESAGVDVGHRTGIRMRHLPDTPDETLPTDTGEETLVTLREGEVESGSTLTGGLEQFDVEEFVIEESKPWSLQSRLESELDESRVIREITFTLKGKFNGRDMKNVVNELIEKHEDEMQSMKLSARVVRK